MPLVATCLECPSMWVDRMDSRGSTIQAVSYAIQHYKETGHKYVTKIATGQESGD